MQRPDPPLGLDFARLARARVYDLAHGLKRGIPVSPNHPPYQMALLRRHGDMVRPDGGSAANEVLVLGGHVGTHVDALCHVSQDGLLHGGIRADEVTSHEGFSAHGAETIPLLLGRGVLLDVAAVHGVDVLEPGYEITADDLAAAEKETGTDVQPGDAVLIRSGWAQHWPDPERFVGRASGAPGPGPDAARWLVDRAVRITGAETVAYEVIHPGAGHSVLPVHRILLVEAGINIIEMLDLTALAADRVGQFLFVLAPLKLLGATGAPARPLAIVD